MSVSGNTADEYDIVDHDETALSPEVIAQIREWLQPTDYLAESGEFRRHLASRAPDTGLWICETEEYKKWHDSGDHGSLWIKGVPGAGKSVMAASLVQHLKTTEDCPVLFFFFRNIVAANFSPRALIQDWLAQLLPNSPKLQFALQLRLKSSLAETSDNDLIQLFLDGLSCVPKVYCVGDALDEMTTENRPFLDKLNGLATYRPRSLKLLITSRPKQYLQSALRDSSIVHISLQQRLVDADLTSYLKHRFDVAPKSASQLHLREHVVKMVARRSEGLFLYAKLTMDQVEGALLSSEPVNVDSLEQSLPLGLEQTYNSVLAKQREDHAVSTAVQVLVLGAVTHASRPLRLYELASLVQCVCPDLNPTGGYKVLVGSCCGPLVEILEDETLQVIHHSFTEFLRGDTRGENARVRSSSEFPIIDSGEAHKRMALGCLRYLQSGSLLLEGEIADTTVANASITYRKPRHQVDFNKEHYEQSILGVKEEEDPFDYREARLQYPFLHYAVGNWSYHASRYDVRDEDLFSAVTEFLNPSSLAFLRWLVLEWGSTSKSKGTTEGIPTALHIAAFSGMSALASELIDQGLSVSEKDAQERAPLHWAATNGHAKVASLLIQHGADPDSADGRGLKPIHLAALRNQTSVVTVLLRASVEPETIKTRESRAGRLLGGETSTIGETAIYYASQAGHTETVLAMVSFCKPKVLEQLLCECCRYGRDDSVLGILATSNASANASYQGATALYRACGSTNVRIVEALLSRGADARKTSSWSNRDRRRGFGTSKADKESPLHHLVSRWTEENNTACKAILRLLVKAGVDLDQLDGDGFTALHWTAKSNNVRVPAMRALVEAGADVQKTDPGGDTTLHRVFRAYRDPEAVRLLIEHGSDPNRRGDRGETALHCCLEQPGMVRGIENTEAIVKYLLEHGADPNAKNNYGSTPILRAMSSGPAVFRILFSRCDDDAVKKQCWFSLADRYKVEDFVICLEMLLAEGIDINTRRSHDGRTLYLCCLKNDEKLRVLRDRGANPREVDDYGNNSLHVLCSGNVIMRDRFEKIMAEDGIDPLERNNRGETLLHHVAGWYNRDPKFDGFIRWLISLGIPINAVDNEGRSVLHITQRTSRYGQTVFVSSNLGKADRTDHTHERVTFIEALKTGGEINFELRDKNGLAPVHMAAMRSGIALAHLVAVGADLGFLTGDSQNVLHLACRARQPDIVGQILDQESSVDVNQRDEFDRTPLYYACTSGKPESVAFLLNHGADVNIVDEDDRTPLHTCAEFRAEQDLWDARWHRDRWLREPPRQDSFRPDSFRPPGYVGDPWYANRYGEPRANIRRSLFPELITIVKMLLAAGVDVAAVDEKNRTALDVALDEGCAEVIEVFGNDNKLFLAASENLKSNKKTKEMTNQHRSWMRTQMMLMRPRSAQQVLSQDPSIFDQVLESPSMYLDLVTSEDAVRIISQTYEANPLNGSLYSLLEVLLKPNHLEVAEHVPQLVLHYSSFELTKAAMVRMHRETKKRPQNILTPLQLACQCSEPNMLMLKALAEKLHVDINGQCATLDGQRYARDSQIVPGGTALHVLASADSWWQVEGLRYLLQRGAAVDIRDEKGQTPLHIAARGKHSTHNEVEGFWRLNAVRVLLDHGADPNALDKEELTALHKASGAPDILRELLRRGADASLGETSPLFLAIHDQNLGAFEALLDAGVSVDSIDEKRHSRDIHYSLRESRNVYALLCTAYAEELNSHVPESVPLLRALVERGASLYQPLNDTETMIHFLFEYPEYEVSDTLLSEPCVSRIDFNRRDQRGRTVLMAACHWRDVLPGYSHKHWDPKATGLPIRILDHGADVTLIDKEGKTALHYILENPGMPDDVLIQFINHDKVAPILLVNDAAGFSPFHYALRLLRPAICELLLSKGAKLLEPDPNGQTALHHIATQGFQTRRERFSEGHLSIDLPKDYFDQCLALWKRFIAEGGTINLADKAGNTPLLTYVLSPGTDGHRYEKGYVCHKEHYDKLFPVDSGVDVYAVNADGETALHLIARRSPRGSEHDPVLFEMMMAKGLDPLKEDGKGRSALDVASACEQDEIVKILGRK